MVGGSVYALHSVDLDISRHMIHVKGLKQRMRIVALSDLHAPCSYISTTDLIKAVNAQKPDVLILAGDMFGVPDFEGTVIGLKEAKAGFAKLAVLGNWEYQLKLNLESLKKAYEDAGIKLLVNDTCEVNGLKILGLDDFLHGFPNYKLAYDRAGNTLPELVVSHCPASFDSIKPHPQNPKILISGHTHGGQIAPFGHVLVIPDGSGCYVKGWYHRGNSSMYVMRGVGASILPVRIGARPELLVLDLLPA